MAWSMPDQLQCNETSWLYLGNEEVYIEPEDGVEAGCEENPQFSCVELMITIAPFQVIYAYKGRAGGGGDAGNESC